ncbi:hypothetical protein AJ80_03513 [Polytolypa hystricis UAMH7299]|uniref:Uncharacterized protein n=1 Tax=Polytolypa hystricis (strain UAMH7299) TaxID=1447883 RepID=A0A2B7YIB7_POLH7|nr:hypothetical protein AJ80_03513 [Polytolypa hystricis UAMH7299]
MSQRYVRLRLNDPAHPSIAKYSITGLNLSPDDDAREIFIKIVIAPRYCRSTWRLEPTINQLATAHEGYSR